MHVRDVILHLTHQNVLCCSSDDICNNNFLLSVHPTLVQHLQWQRLIEVLPVVSLPVTFTADHKELEIYTDPMLKAVFSNLLDNSLRHGGAVTGIGLSVLESGDQVRIRWMDNGNGIPDHEKNTIFEQGYGLNSGLGLFLVREILEITGISIHENGVETDGACFDIQIPEGMFRFRNPAQNNFENER